MANSSAHRLLPDHLHHHHHHHRLSHSSSGSVSLPAQPPSNGGLSVATLHQHLAASEGARSGSEGPGGQAGNGKAHFKGHQRRQSVARLLPDISKLRLLSWLVEASSELINCDIAIMDGVYAKLNRSRESLLFWDSNNTTASQLLQTSPNKQQQVPRRPPPPPPSVQPVANRIVLSQRRQQRKLSNLPLAIQQQVAGSGRNHHSLPITNYDASSLAAVSMSPSLGSQSRKSSTATRSIGVTRQSTLANVDTDSLFSSFRSAPGQNQMSTTTTTTTTAATTLDALLISGQQLADGNKQPIALEATGQESANSCVDNANEESCDSNQSDDDDNSSAASSSSGIHGGETSLSSTGSHSGSSSSAASTASGDLATGNVRASRHASHPLEAGGGGSLLDDQASSPVMSSAELLSEKIRRTVMKHNYLQSLLVNIIRQHDKQRDLLNQQRRRQMSIDQFNLSRIQQQHQQQRIDLADIADALDDGCFCVCHSSKPPPPAVDNKTSEIPIHGRSSTLPSNSSRKQQQQQQCEQSLIVAGNNQVSAPSRKVRRSKKNRDGRASNELDRQDIINLLSDKLCENCFETHYWLHGCSLELMQLPKGASNRNQDTSSNNHSTSNSCSSTNSQDSNSIVAKRNATFIKLVQQEVRTTLSKSIELIDLIRKEIKLPESIKQKQLMRCFSASIQLLTSVGHYVVPTQDISTCIPEVIGQQETTLFSLPSSDFDHLLLYPPTLNSSSSNHLQQSSQQTSSSTSSSSATTTRNSNYHLAQVPDIPIRRRYHARKFPGGNCGGSVCSSSLSEPSSTCSAPTTTSVSSTPVVAPNPKNQEDDKVVEQALSSNLQKLKASDITKCIALGSTTPVSTTTSGAQAQVQESSSGASSNNSSASSSIARGAVQQSSITRAQTSSAILDGKTSHDLSFEAIANLSRQQTEDDILYQSRPKFWQSSKFNFIKKLLHVKQQRLLRQQSKDRRIYNNKVQNKFRLVMKDLTHFNKSQQLLTTENGVNSLLTSMRNVLEFGLYLTLKLY